MDHCRQDVQAKFFLDLAHEWHFPIRHMRCAKSRLLIQCVECRRWTSIWLVTLRCCDWFNAAKFKLERQSVKAAALLFMA